MKRLLPLVILGASAVMLAGCKEKKQSEETITTHYVPYKLQAPIAMAEDNQQASAQWMGKSYHVSVSRQPLDSVMVSDDRGQKYKDNRVKIIVTRPDGSVFTEKAFTKSAFMSYIQEPFKSGGILAGIRFENAEAKGLKFSVVVAMPDAVDDLFVPLEMTIDADGGLGIRQDDDMNLIDYDVDDEGV